LSISDHFTSGHFVLPIVNDHSRKCFCSNDRQPAARLENSGLRTKKIKQEVLRT
jgi:hypothetical protein